MEVSRQSHTLVTLCSGRESPVSIQWEMGWAPEVVGHFGEEINFLPHWDSNPGLSSL